MAWRQVGCQGYAPKLDLLAVVDIAIGRYWRVRQVITPIEVPFATAAHQFAVESAGDNLRAGLTFEFGKSSAVVKMRVAIQQDFHVLRMKAEFFDVGFNLREHLSMTGIK